MLCFCYIRITFTYSTTAEPDKDLGIWALTLNPKPLPPRHLTAGTQSLEDTECRRKTCRFGTMFVFRVYIKIPFKVPTGNST